jgi:hypothetical protein
MCTVLRGFVCQVQLCCSPPVAARLLAASCKIVLHAACGIRGSQLLVVRTAPGSVEISQET